MLALEGVRRPEVARAPVLPPVPFPHPVVQTGVPFVSFQDPRASVFAGPQATDGAALVEPASAGRSGFSPPQTPATYAPLGGASLFGAVPPPQARPALCRLPVAS